MNRQVVSRRVNQQQRAKCHHHQITPSGGRPLQLPEQTLIFDYIHVFNCYFRALTRTLMAPRVSKAIFPGCQENFFSSRFSQLSAIIFARRWNMIQLQWCPCERRIWQQCSVTLRTFHNLICCERKKASLPVRLSQPWVFFMKITPRFVCEWLWQFRHVNEKVPHEKDSRMRIQFFTPSLPADGVNKIFQSINIFPSALSPLCWQAKRLRAPLDVIWFDIHVVGDFTFMIENNFSFYRALLKHENTSNKWMNERDVYLSTTQGRRTSRQSSVEKNSFTRGNEWENHRLLLLLFSVPPHFEAKQRLTTQRRRGKHKKIIQFIPIFFIFLSIVINLEYFLRVQASVSSRTAFCKDPWCSQ